MGMISIKEIEVVELFQYFNYKIMMDNFEDNKFLFLYGENGSGKTTILKSIVYLLSSKDKSGHKSRLANLIFKKIIVHLSNGVSIGAIRSEDHIGSFDYIIYESGIIRHKLSLIATDKGEEGFTIVFDDNDKRNFKLLEMYKYVSQLNIRLVFLSDDRNTMDLDPDQYNENDLILTPEHSKEKVLNKKYLKQVGEYIDIDQTLVIINKLEKWLRLKVLIASRKGERNTTKLYEGIVKQIISTDISEISNLSEKIDNIQSLIIEVGKRTKLYAEYGLMTSSEYTEILNAFNLVKDDKKTIIYNIIEPYIRGIQEKLNALESIHNLISTFIEQMNSFFSYKKISYGLQSGFKITQTYSKEKISFDKLSSGEKQLMLIVGTTILASNKDTIFIIDEPEISLNVTWQRKLLNTLDKFGKINTIQFIIATHSIELLSNKKYQVKKLINEKDE